MSHMMSLGRLFIFAVLLGVLLLLAVHLVLIVTDSTTPLDINHMKSSFLRNLYLSHSLMEPNYFMAKLMKPNGSVKCDRCDERYDMCFISGPTLMDPFRSALFPMDEPSRFLTIIRPYPRKMDPSAMDLVKWIAITSFLPNESCEFTHHSPALLFSAGGYTGNFFHDFNDGIIPIFITVRSFFIDRDFIFVISDCKSWWLKKYGDILSHLSQHPIINMDNASTTHCFPSATVGLISHGYMTINPELMHQSKRRTFLGFQNFLKSVYSKGEITVSSPFSEPSKPRLILVERKGNAGRVILNQDEVVNAATQIGFSVYVFDPTHESSLANAFNLIQRSHAMFGVHGAGLTHSLFLRPDSVFIQVVPIGIEMDANFCFENSAKALGLEYMEYKISYNESSLSEKYDSNSLVIRDPITYAIGYWERKNIYFHTNVTLDMVRVMAYLRNAFVKAKTLMDKEG